MSNYSGLKRFLSCLTLLSFWPIVCSVFWFTQTGDHCSTINQTFSTETNARAITRTRQKLWWSLLIHNVIVFILCGSLLFLWIEGQMIGNVVHEMGGLIFTGLGGLVVFDGIVFGAIIGPLKKVSSSQWSLFFRVMFAAIPVIGIKSTMASLYNLVE